MRIETVLTGKGEALCANSMQRHVHARFFRFSAQTADDGVETRIVKVRVAFAQSFDERTSFNGLASFPEQPFQKAPFRGGQTEVMTQAVAKHPPAFRQDP